MAKLSSVFVILVMLSVDTTHASCNNDGLSEDLMDMMCKHRNKKDVEHSSGVRPAFTASKASTTDIRAEEIIKFETVWLNKGGAYDPKTGVFTVPRSGLYMISGSLMSVTGLQLHCHLWKNGKANVGVYGIGYSQGSLNTVMELKKGDRIYIQHDNKDREKIYGGHWSMFSGYLISE